MSALSLSLIAAAIVSILSIIGILSLAINDKLLNKILILLVSFSAGSLMGGAFFHLLPESVGVYNGSLLGFVYVVVGFSIFLILERILRWHHCHDKECETHKHLGSINLIGDGVHNIIDGIIIFSAFSVSPAVGLPVTVSIILHELPQEIGDFGILLYSGFKKSKALIYNFITASVVFIGVLLGYLLLNRVEDLNSFLLPFAAGGFLYIAASDLIPELHKENNTARSILSFVMFFIALALMLLLKIYSK